VIAAAWLAACGGSPAGPSTGTPTPTPAGETHTVSVVVFEDWDNDNVRNASDRGLGGIEVDIASRKAVTDGTGRATVTGVPKGTHVVRFTPATAPPFLTVTRGEVTTTSPPAGDTLLPLGFPIGSNRPGLYLAFGDSISSGDLSSDGYGYRARLGRKLAGFYGRPIDVDYRGGSGGRTPMAVDRVEGDVRQVRPAFTLVFWGVNDWAGGACVPERCDTVPNLRQMIRSVKGSNSLPAVATLTPSYTGWDSRTPAERNEWVKGINALIRTMAPQEGAVLVDLEAAFNREGGFTRLLGDHLHPNDAGYEVIAETFFQALTRPRGAGAAWADPPTLFTSPSAP
jgi:lysophospholipase L1-like esterase